MKQRKRVSASGKSGRRSPKSPKGKTKGKTKKNGQRRVLTLHASIEESKRHRVSMQEVLEFYKPIKKPVTLRLDADVLAWFKRDGRRYQTRINAALRRVMEREMKAE